MREPLIANGVDAAADALARLDDAGAEPALLELAHCREAGYSGTDDHDIAGAR